MNLFDSLRPRRPGPLSLVFCVLVTAASMATPAAAQTHGGDASRCAKLATSLTLPHTMVTSVQPVAAGQFVAPEGNAAARQAAAGLPAFCRVSLKIAPTAD